MLQLIGVFLIGLAAGVGFFLGKKLVDIAFKAIANHEK